MYSIYDDRDPSQKLFYYEIEEMFALTRDESLYRKFMPSMEDEYIHLTEDRRSIFDILLKRSASKVQELVQSLNDELVDAFIYNALPEATVEELNDATDYSDGLVYKVTDSGTLTPGSVVVAANDKVYYNESSSEWVKDNTKTEKYILYYLDMPYNFNLNNLIPFDEKVQEYLSIWIVKEWFKRQKYDLQLIDIELENLTDDLRRLVNYRTKTYRSSSFLS